MLDKTLVELANTEKFNEYCLLNTETGETTFSNISHVPGFTGLYFKDSITFFAIYPSKNGPLVFFNGKEYEINKTLSIDLLKKNDKIRTFTINDYNIGITYLTSPYIGFDSWSDEIDVDLFYMIEQSYREQKFYEKYTLDD
jgi:hypothetical protein